MLSLKERLKNVEILGFPPNSPPDNRAVKLPGGSPQGPKVPMRVSVFHWQQR